MSDLQAKLEDTLAGISPVVVIPTLEMIARGRALLEQDNAKRMLWRKAATALGRVSTRRRLKGQAGGAQ